MGDRRRRDPSASISVSVAQDQTLVREVLVRLLLEDGHIDVVSQGDSIDDVVRSLRSTPCELVLVDSRCVEAEGAAALWKIRRAAPEVCVLLMADEVDTDQVATSLSNGADGLVLKSVAVPALLDTARRLVARGPTPSPATVARPPD